MFVEQKYREPPRQEMVSSRNWVAGNQGWVMNIFLEVAPHNVGDVAPGGECVPWWGKHTVVEANWLLLLLNDMFS